MKICNENKTIMKRRGRPSKIKVKHLAEYFKNNYSGNIYDQIKNLTAGSDVIKKAALNLYNRNDDNTCYNIVKAIRRNSGGIIEYLKPKINIIQNVIIRESDANYGKTNLLQNKSKSDQTIETVTSEVSDCIYSDISPKVVNYNHNKFGQHSNYLSDKNYSCEESYNETEFSDVFASNNFDKNIKSSTPQISNQLTNNTDPLGNVSSINENFTIIYSNLNRSSEISTSNEHIPLTFLELKETRANNETLLPPNSINLKTNNWTTPTYSDCKFYEGCFAITHHELLLISKGNKLTTGYTYLVEKKISQFVNNICVINFKGNRYNVRNDVFICIFMQKNPHPRIFQWSY
ncbi:uncharacterized protein [Leptinotarsa decemlineata]|uniref:uncharacterized protein n=1 Tax=Leptinotarsa decemlineata TaxID=7539 RepID=UPI003D307FED